MATSNAGAVAGDHPSPGSAAARWAPMTRRASFVFPLLWLLAGCAIGPNYRRPDVDMPADYFAAPSPVDASSIADMPWWDVLRDPVLKALIEEALANNQDLAIAAQRVEQARYQVGVVRADLMPQVGYQGSAQRGQAGGDTGSLGFALGTNQFLGAFQMAWEIDLWGRIRRATEASLANLLATEAAQRGVILSLVTEVAQTYLQLRELDAELEITHTTRGVYESVRDLFEATYRGGVGDKLAVSRASASLADAEAGIPAVEQQIVTTENALNVLLGRNPRAIPRGVPLKQIALPVDVPAGLPSSLLERRPDILQAEQNIVASNALVGVAIGSFLPKFGLTSVYGGTSSVIENVVKSGGNVWLIAGSLAGPLFQGGRLYYSYKGSVAAWEEQKLAYQATVVGALRDVSNALIARQKQSEQLTSRAKQVQELEDAYRLSVIRYKEGIALYFEVLEALQQLYPAELTLVRTQYGQAAAVVQLYKALGGGWQGEEQQHPDRYPRRRELLDRLVPGAATDPG